MMVDIFLPALHSHSLSVKSGGGSSDVYDLHCRCLISFGNKVMSFECTHIFEYLFLFSM